jgi:hypothetical protein
MARPKRVDHTSGVVSNCEGGDLAPRRGQGNISESAASVVDARERRWCTGRINGFTGKGAVVNMTFCESKGG